MSQIADLSQMLTEARASRRNLFKKVAAGSIAVAAGSIAVAAGAVLEGCGGSHHDTPSSTIAPADVLNFALNLEYLEAEYYLYGTVGQGLNAADTGNTSATISGDAFPTTGPVAFTKYGGIAAEIAKDELNHVRFLRTNLGSAAVARPPIDLVASFNAAAVAAGIGSTFNPFANETNFILGAFIFEDVGVTAYHGGAGYLTTSAYLSAAAGILGTEAYHAGAIRDIIVELGGSAITIANQISALRAKADGSGGTGNETPINSSSTPVIAPGDSNSIAYARTPQEVLNIVYLGAKPHGGFFPAGLNGKIK